MLDTFEKGEYLNVRSKLASQTKLLAKMVSLLVVR